MKRFIALPPKNNIALSLLIGLILASLGLTGCGGKLGKIETSTVDTAIVNAEAAIAAAQDADAPSLASDLFESAKTNLEAAKTALTEKRGDDALRLAYQATVDARLAQMNSVNVTMNSELNASILQKEAEAKDLRHSLRHKETELAGVQSEIQDIQKEEKQLKQAVHDLQNENRELGNTRAAYGKQVAQLSETLSEIQERAQQAETEIRNYGREVASLRRRLEVADRRVKEEGYQKRAVVAEIDSLRRQLRERSMRNISSRRQQKRALMLTVNRHFILLKQGGLPSLRHRSQRVRLPSVIGHARGMRKTSMPILCTMNPVLLPIKL